ncbi:SAF domain-containing protein [Cellulomonas endophytica]|uniref:SAF domain-containing protein n=1 Tax=Cellulomonas endophytica TaxID=2494735 RepID=UPI0013E93FC9|nr:SAF domain-containing protein [Cellulomonas endophytica]
MLAWRARGPVAAALVALAAAVLLRPVPPPADTGVVVAARPLAVGAVLAPGDLRAVRRPEGGPVTPPTGELVGRTLVVDVPAGLPLVADLVSGAAGRVPDGAVVVAVPVTDAALAPFLVAGAHADVLAPFAPDPLGAGRTAADPVLPVAPGPAATLPGAAEPGRASEDPSPDGASADDPAPGPATPGDGARDDLAGVEPGSVGPAQGGPVPGSAVPADPVPADAAGVDVVPAGRSLRVVTRGLVLPAGGVDGASRGSGPGSGLGAALDGGGGTSSVLLAVRPAEAEALVAATAAGPVTVLVVP